MYSEVPCEKKISINDLQASMTLARDIHALDASVIMKKDRVIESVDFDKLRKNNIKYAYIYADAALGLSDAVERRGDVPEFIPLEKTREFNDFRATYNDKTEEVRSSLLAISDGKEIQLDRLYSLTNGIIEKVKYKKDIFSYLSSIRGKDEHTFTHSNNVALLCNLFGRWLGMSGSDLVHLTTAGILHDIGKTKIPDSVLNKKGALTDKEFQTMKQHTSFGYRILGDQARAENLPQEITQVALLHHEKINGKGYPLGLTGDMTPDFVKIVTICDIYDAMTANRCYRPKMCAFDVIKNFEQKSFGELDTKYLLVFLENIAYNYLGCWVTLSDGRVGKVAFVNRSALSRPIVTVGDDVVDLSVPNTTLTIESVV